MKSFISLKDIKKLIILLSEKEKKQFKTVIFINIISSFLELFSIGMVYPLVIAIISPNKLIENQFINFILENYSPFRGNEFIVFCLILVSISFLLKNIFLVYMVWYRIRFFEYVSNSIGVKLFKNYLGTSYEFHSRKNSGELLRNIMEQVKILSNSFLHPLSALIEVIIIGIPMLIFLLYLNWFSIFFILISVVGPGLVFLKIFNPKINAHAKSNLDAQEAKNTNVIEGMANIKEMKIYKKSQYFLNKFKLSAQTETEAKAYFISIVSTPRMLIETIAVISVFTVMTIMILMGYTSDEIVIYLGIFAVASLKLFPICIQILQSIQQFNFGRTSLDLIYDELYSESFSVSDEMNEQTDNPKNNDIPFKKKIELKDIHFQYLETEEEVIKGLSLEILKNQSIALVGSSGAGKTTLVDLLIGLLSATSGKILVDGVDVTDKNLWTSKIGYVPQAIYLQDTSIKKNIAFGVSDDLIDEKLLDGVIRAAQLTEFIDNLPEKINTRIGERGVKISGGQRQRISIARALYHKPEILILDEATSALDNITEKMFVKTLKEFKGKLTIIIIAHRLTTVERCDQIFLMENGAISESGSFEELSKKSEKFKELLRASKN